MPQAELGFDGLRFGYSPNPPTPNTYPPSYSQVSGTRQPDRGRPAGRPEPGPGSPPPSPDTDRLNGPGPRNANRPAQASPPPQWREEGQGIDVERLRKRDQQRGSGQPTLPPCCGLLRPSTPGPALPSIGAGLGEPRQHGTWGEK